MVWKIILFLSALFPSFCSGQQNLAAFKPSNQSSTYSVYGAQLANDENERTCSIAGEPDTSMQEKVFGWWQVDLLRSYSVSHLLIKTSPNPYEANFLNNFIVLVTNDKRVDSVDSTDICATYIDNDPPVDGWISLNCNSSGRFVTIKRGGGFRHDAISFCEVSVTNGNSSAQCPSMQFRCLSGRCINASKHCNGISDCSDNSDEVGCIASSTSTTRGPLPSSSTLTSRIPPMSSTFATKLPPSLPVSTARLPSSLTTSSTRRSSATTFTTRSLITSTRTPSTTSTRKPSPSSSPTSAPRSYCGHGSFDCRNGTCINMRLLCDGFFDCFNKIDEDSCTTGNSCDSDEFVCLNHQCIHKSLACDGFTDCSDDSDELPSQCGNSTISPFTCANGYRACGDGSCIPSAKICDRIISCSDKSDESTKTCGIPFNNCALGDFICFNGECISGSNKCDDRPDCTDGSDESIETCGYSPPKTPCLAEAEFTCSDGSCINNDLQCNGIADCPAGEDESQCANCTGNEFLCLLDNACIPLFKRCNGRADCDDQSDEKECDKCSSPALHCKPLMICLTPELVCNYISDCPDGSDESNCSNCQAGFSRCTYGPCIPDKYLCDGNLDCPYGEDEDLSMCTKLCTEHGFYCSYFGCISRTLLCNGIFDCPFEEDEKEESCELVGVCGKNQYKCLDKKCIPNEWICDGEPDCQLGEDENPDECESCDASQFQCLSRKSECISHSYRCDGNQDCTDGSDELGCVWMEQAVNREWHILVLIGNKPHTLCPDSIDVEWKAIICKYMSITSRPPLNVTGIDIAGFASLNPDFELKSIFDLIKAFQIRSFCNTIQSLKCDLSKKCGAVDSDSSLVSGYPAERGTWPWHALLRVYPSKICGATFVGGHWFLTSASCVTTKGSNSPLNTRSVKLYMDSLRNDGAGGKLLSILKIIVHPDYNHRTGSSDVALVRTQSTSDGPEGHEICLPDPFKYTNEETSKLKICYVSGFGFNRRDGFPSPVLLSARFDMMDQKQCMANIFNSSNIRAIVDYTENLCAGSYEPPYGFNICEYDFGGPLVCRDNDLKWMQIGIASRNIGSACKNSLFMRITHYLGFIYDTMIINN